MKQLTLSNKHLTLETKRASGDSRFSIDIAEPADVASPEVVHIACTAAAMGYDRLVFEEGAPESAYFPIYGGQNVPSTVRINQTLMETGFYDPRNFTSTPSGVRAVNPHRIDYNVFVDVLRQINAEAQKPKSVAPAPEVLCVPKAPAKGARLFCVALSNDPGARLFAVAECPEKAMTFLANGIVENVVMMDLEGMDGPDAAITAIDCGASDRGEGLILWHENDIFDLTVPAVLGTVLEERLDQFSIPATRFIRFAQYLGQAEKNPIYVA